MSGSLYIHVPFCKKKCNYCSFYVIRSREEGFKVYTNALIQEIKQTKDIFTKIESIYFGGGTPTQLPMPYFRQIMQELDVSCSEVTLEANPEDLSIERLKEYKSLGINRLSIGAQSFNDSELIVLGRGHSKNKTRQVIEDASAVGFTNISIDLMVDLPNQTLKSLDHTLNHLALLPIQHISLYNLQIEKNSLFYAKKQTLSLPDEKESLQIYNKIINSIENLGFSRYEISAFCKQGFESKHNTRYWQAKEFIGLGPSAFSYRNHERYQNAKSLYRWADAINNKTSAVEFREKLETKESVKERLAIALRLTNGVNLDQWRLEKETLDQIESLIQKNLLIKRGATIKMSQKGLLFYDTLASELV